VAPAEEPEINHLDLKQSAEGRERRRREEERRRRERRRQERRRRERRRQERRRGVNNEFRRLITLGNN